MRPCAKCGGVEFYTEGQPSTCKTCVKARSAARYAAKRGEILAAGKARRAAAAPRPERPRLPEAELNRRRVAGKRRWEAANPEKIKAMKARSYVRNRAAIRDRARKRMTPEMRAAAVTRALRWAAENPERARRHAHTKTLNRRARTFAGFIERVDAEVVYQMHGGRCGICGEFIAGDFHVDHVVPLALGGLHGYVNVQPAHPVCNSRKGAKVVF